MKKRLSKEEQPEVRRRQMVDGSGKGLSDGRRIASPLIRAYLGY